MVNCLQVVVVQARAKYSLKHQRCHPRLQNTSPSELSSWVKHTSPCQVSALLQATFFFLVAYYYLPVFGPPAMAKAGSVVAVLAGPATAVDRLKPYTDGV